MKQKANKNQKDTVFRRIFHNKERLLELYNAINHTNYDNPDDLTIKTLHGKTFLGMRNDLSFIFDDELNLYEHNSTPCPNIALRDLLYIASSYREMYSLKDLYKSSPIKIPAPRFFVFYNGTLQLPDRFEYRLSDMFIKETANPCLELKVTVLNVNEGRNKELMESCKSLRDYSLFVGKVRKYTQEAKLKNSKDYFISHKKELIEKAVIKAIDECITENILRDYFIQNRQEAIDMSTLECTAEIYYKAVSEENYDKGVSQGVNDTNSFYSWLFSNGRDSDAKKAALDKAYFDKLYKEYESAKSKKM